VLRRRPGGRKVGEESVPLDEVGAGTIRLNIAFRPIDRAPLDLDRSTSVRSGIIKSGLLVPDRAIGNREG
jgi:hypothetical protein